MTDDLTSLRSVAVFCGSRHGDRPAFTELAAHVGARLAERGLTVVYGGGHVGLMGEVADAALAAGGRVVGVIPRALDDRELSHHEVTELHVVDTMHERKALMAELSDAFIALPGGAGTIEEITEQWTWAQLGIHDKPSALLDLPASGAQGFWEPVRQMFGTMTSAGFVDPDSVTIPYVGDDLDDVLAELQRRAVPPPVLDVEIDEPDLDELV